MSKFIIPTTCIRCNQGILFPKEQKVTLQTTREDGVETEKQVDYNLCSECNNTFGSIIRIWRRPKKKDIAYFFNNRHEGIELAEGAIP